MIASIPGWISVSALISVLYACAGWWSARVACRSMPAPDVRVRPNANEIRAAAALLEINFPASNAVIRKARHDLMPRALGDTFPSGQLKSDLMPDIMQAADILEAANAFDEQPPFEAKYLLAYWDYRAGIFGRLWARHSPPLIVRRLRLQRIAEAYATVMASKIIEEGPR